VAFRGCRASEREREKEREEGRERWRTIHRLSHSPRHKNQFQNLRSEQLSIKVAPVGAKFLPPFISERARECSNLRATCSRRTEEYNERLRSRNVVFNRFTLLAIYPRDERAFPNNGDAVPVGIRTDGGSSSSRTYDLCKEILRWSRRFCRRVLPSDHPACIGDKKCEHGVTGFEIGLKDD